MVNGPEVFWVHRGHIRQVAARRIANVAAAARALFARKDEIAAFTAPLTKSDPPEIALHAEVLWGGNAESSELVIYNLGCCVQIELK